MKKIDFKSMFVGIITGSLLFGGIVGANTLITDNVYLSTHPITVDGKTYKANNPLLNYAGTTYVPLREFGTITGSSVNFTNGTIVINKPTNTSTNTNTPTGSNTSTGSSTSTSTGTSLNGKKITIEAGETDSFYVDLNAANAKSATIAITSGTSYAKVSKTSTTTSGLITVTGQKEGNAIIKVTYSTGKSDVITVNVTGSDEIKIDAGSYGYVEIDLDEYDAEKATLSISSGKDYITLDKTEVTKSEKVKIKGKKAGEAKIKVRFDTGSTEYYDIVVNKAKTVDGELEVSIDKYESQFVYYIDLDEYEADKAKVIVDDTDGCVKVTLGSTSVTSSKTTTSSKALTITGLDEGEAEIEIELLDEDGDDIDSFYIYVSVLDDNDFDYDDYDFEDDYEIDEDDYDELTVDPDYYDAEWATISVITGAEYTHVSKTNITSEKDITIYGDYEGEAIIQVTYSTGDVEYYYIEIVD